MPCLCAVAARDQLSFLQFPSICDNRKRIDSCKVRRREAWIEATKRSDLTESILRNQSICSKHFLSGKPAEFVEEEHLDWIPTKNMGYERQDVNIGRYTRRKEGKWMQ